MKTYFWDKIQVKTCLLTVVPIIIGGICSALGNWDINQNGFAIKVIFLLIISVMYILLIFHYCKNEANQSKVNKIIESENQAYATIMKSLISLYRTSTEGINAIAKNIAKKGQIDLNIWSYDKACMLICSAIHQTILKVSEQGDDFGVTYVKLIEDDSVEKSIKTVGFANNESTAPKVYDVPRKVDESHGYYDTKLFKKNSSDIVTIDTPERIYQLFEYENKEDKLGKYSQYIAVPVFCNDKKMIGLLQIVSYSDSRLGLDNRQLEKIARKYLITYANLFSMVAKVEKGLLSVPNIKVERRDI